VAGSADRGRGCWRGRGLASMAGAMGLGSPAEPSPRGRALQSGGDKRSAELLTVNLTLVRAIGVPEECFDSM